MSVYKIVVTRGAVEMLVGVVDAVTPVDALQKVSDSLREDSPESARSPESRSGAAAAFRAFLAANPEVRVAHVAKAIGIARQSLDFIVKGRTKTPRPAIANKLLAWIEAEKRTRNA
jgi:hypothetical protein